MWPVRGRRRKGHGKVGFKGGRERKGNGENGWVRQTGEGRRGRRSKVGWRL